MRHPFNRFKAGAMTALAAFAVMGFMAESAIAETSIKVDVNLGGPGVTWRRRPATVIVPGTRTRWVRDYSDADVYQYGDSWYCYRGGNWYQSSRYRGPWLQLDVDAVPQQVYYSPGNYHHFDHEVATNVRRDRGRHSGWSGHGDNRDNAGDRGNQGGRGHGRR